MEAVKIEDILEYKFYLPLRPPPIRKSARLW